MVVCSDNDPSNDNITAPKLAAPLDEQNIRTSNIFISGVNFCGKKIGGDISLWEVLIFGKLDLNKRLS